MTAYLYVGTVQQKVITWRWYLQKTKPKSNKIFKLMNF